MTPRQQVLVQNSFAQMAPIADQAEDLFYDRLFTLDPALRSLFKGDRNEQRHKLIATLRLAINNLGDPESLIPIVQQLGLTYARYGVKSTHYITVGLALLWTLGRGLGEAFTPEVEAAWATVYALLCERMQRAIDEANPTYMRPLLSSFLMPAQPM
jgi:hemoglobin-like flavoprotein